MLGLQNMHSQQNSYQVLVSALMMPVQYMVPWPIVTVVPHDASSAKGTTDTWSIIMTGTWDTNGHDLRHHQHFGHPGDNGEHRHMGHTENRKYGCNWHVTSLP